MAIRSVTCYPQPGKTRSRDVLAAFAAGCGGAVAVEPYELKTGAAAFYGVVGIEQLLYQARAAGRDWFYGDNAYFDNCRGTFFRFARNELQWARLATPDYDRAKAAGVKVTPWAQGGAHIVVIEQSAHFLRLCGAGEGWLQTQLNALRAITDREVRVRPWRRDKARAAGTLAADLRGAWALVTHTSAAATEAILAGVPAFVTGACAALPMAAGSLDDIERPARPDGREDWAAGLAAMQWTLEELRNGAATRSGIWR